MDELELFPSYIGRARGGLLERDRSITDDVLNRLRPRFSLLVRKTTIVLLSSLVCRLLLLYSKGERLGSGG